MVAIEICELGTEKNIKINNLNIRTWSLNDLDTNYLGFRYFIQTGIKLEK